MKALLYCCFNKRWPHTASGVRHMYILAGCCKGKKSLAAFINKCYFQLTYVVHSSTDNFTQPTFALYNKISSAIYLTSTWNDFENACYKWFWRVHSCISL